MSSFFDELESQLRAAARERTGPAGRRRGPARPRRPRLRAGLSTVPIVVAVATTVAIVVVALVLVHHGSGGPAQSPGGALPNLNSPQARQELAYIRRATRQTASTSACMRRGPRQPPVIAGPPSRLLLSILGVLRRPAAAADRYRSDANIVGQLYAGATRRARVTDGVSYYIVPGREDPAAGQLPAACLTAQVAALKRELPQIPRALRAQTVALQAQLMAYDRRLLSGRRQDVICLATHARNSGGESCGASVAQIEHGAGLLQEDGNSSTFSGVVPDGVASVTLRFAPSRGQSAASAAGVVEGNVFVVRTPRRPGTGPSEPTVVWRSAQGRVLRTITAPSPGALAAACRRHPLQCGALSGLQTVESSSSASASASATTPAATTTH